jgi:hypothetical protein
MCVSGKALFAPKIEFTPGPAKVPTLPILMCARTLKQKSGCIIRLANIQSFTDQFEDNLVVHLPQASPDLSIAVAR